MDLAGLGVDEERLDLVAVATEQRVRQRAVAPEHACPMEVDQQPCHRIEEPVPVRAGTEREAHQQAAVLDREREVLGHEDRRVTLWRFGDADGLDRRQAECLEVPEHVELRPADRQRLLLERVSPVARDEEADEVTGGTDGQFAELERIGRPVRERKLPRQVEQDPGAIAESQPRKGLLGSGVAQSFLRRYAATVAS